MVVAVFVLCVIGVLLAAEIAVLHILTTKRLDWLKAVLVPWVDNISITLASMNVGVNPASVFLKELVSAGFAYTPDPVLDPRLVDTAQMVCRMASGARGYSVEEIEAAVQHELSVDYKQAAVFAAVAVRSYCPGIQLPPGSIPGTEARQRHGDN